MTLTTHAIVGASAATMFSFHPAAAIAAAFLSHFAIDVTPHWDYILRSGREDPQNPMNSDMIIGKDFIFDLVRVCVDALLGIALSLLIFFPQESYQLLIVLLGAGFGILPDPLQFAYWKIRKEPFLSLQRFHRWAHSKDKSLLGRWKIGVFYQFSLVLGFLLLTKLYFLL